jgi:hypothetical protein
VCSGRISCSRESDKIANLNNICFPNGIRSLHFKSYDIWMDRQQITGIKYGQKLTLPWHVEIKNTGDLQFMY